MTSLLLFFIIFFIVAVVAIVIYEKVIHPLLFKEELEGTLETAAEGKIRKDVQKKVKEILEGEDDADSR